MSEQEDAEFLLQLAIQAQEEIKEQLLSEIAELENEQRPSRPPVNTLNFYRSSLQRAQEEKQGLQDQISKFNSVILPGLERHLERLREKRAAINEQIEKYRLARQEQIDPASLQESLTRELAELGAREKDLQNQAGIARAELRALQEAILLQQRESARREWEVEMADEHGLNAKLPGRRRSNTTSTVQKPTRVRRTSMKVRKPLELL